MQRKTQSASQVQLPGFLRRWIEWTSPNPGSRNYGRNPEWREEIASLMFLIVLALVIWPIPSAVMSGNIPQIIVLTVVLIVDIVALFIKRAGYLRIAGGIVICTIEFGLSIAILTWPGGIDAARLPLFDLLIQTGVVAIAFFSPSIIFFITLFNCAFILLYVNIGPHTKELGSYLARDFVGTLNPAILLELFVAISSWFLIATLIKAIYRADRAQEMADLKEKENERQKRELDMSRQVEEGIQHILSSLNAVVSKNDFTVRVPLAQENILWRVGRAINNLLARLQGLKQERAELERTRAVAQQIAEYVRRGRPIPLDQWTGTSLDPLIIELNKQMQLAPKNPGAGGHIERPFPHRP